MRMSRQVSLALTLALAGPAVARAQTLAQRLVFNTVAPCRIVDTRQSAAGALAPGVPRAFHVVGSASDFAAQGGVAGGCGIPGFAGSLAQAQAVAFNFVAVNPSGAGNLRAWPSDQAAPNASILNYSSGLSLANGIAVPVRQDQEGGDLTVRADVSGAQVVVDVVGYYRLVTQLDGTGSGIDADALDGLDAAAFAAAGHNHDGVYAPVAHNHDASYWKLNGNAATTPGTHFLGTSDNQALEMKVNGARALRIEPDTTPKMIAGFPGNFAAPGATGAVVAGGGQAASPNRVSGALGFVGSGFGNEAGATAVVAGGIANDATGSSSAVLGGVNNHAIGSSSTVLGGADNRASGLFSLAAGRGARANHRGAFVWADGQTTTVASTGDDQFIVRAQGGLWFGSSSTVSITAGRLIDTDTGAHLTSGGAWTNASDSALKENFEPIDGAAVLDAVARLRLASWNYKAEGEDVRHVGPTAQDFRAAFGLGADDRSITTVDTAGVALAAIQELERRTREVAALTREVRELRELLEGLRAGQR